MVEKDSGHDIYFARDGGLDKLLQTETIQV
jgi:hypothetical protein